MQWTRKGKIEILKENKKGDVCYLTYPDMDNLDFIVHGFSTRLGGVSKDHLSGMNLSFSRGDDPENVQENFKRIAEAIGFAKEDLVFSDQTHTKNVRVVTQKDRGKGIIISRDYTDVDGLVTNVPGLVLATFYADCVPLYFVDPVHKAIGLSHSGWKGTVQKIGRETIRCMKENYGTDPKDLITAVGPSICQSCYEVSGDVIEQFKLNFDSSYWDELFYQKKNGKYQLNLWKANEIVFLESGVTKEHISMTDICTCCNPSLLFSHRASLGQRGNLAAFLGIRNESV